MRSIILATALTADDKRAIACEMCLHARQVLRGNLAEPSVWRCGLRRIGCSVIAVHTSVGFVASFTLSSASRRYPVGEVVYNIAQPRELQVRGLAHEFGHALCQGWVPDSIYDTEVVYSEHDDPPGVRHQIARLFEQMMVG